MMGRVMADLARLGAPILGPSMGSPEPGPGVLFIVVGELLDQSPAGVVDGSGNDDSELTKRSPSGLPPEAGTPCPLSRSFSPEELPGGMVSDFMPSRDGMSTLAPRTASGTVIGTSTTRFRSSRLK